MTQIGAIILLSSLGLGRCLPLDNLETLVLDFVRSSVYRRIALELDHIGLEMMTCFTLSDSLAVILQGSPLFEAILCLL